MGLGAWVLLVFAGLCSSPEPSGTWETNGSTQAGSRALLGAVWPRPRFSVSASEAALASGFHAAIYSDGLGQLCPTGVGAVRVCPRSERFQVLH